MDNFIYDVIKMILVFFNVISNDVGVKVLVGFSLRNVLFVESVSISGNISFIGMFFGRVFSIFRFEILVEVIIVNEIVVVEIIGFRN